MKQLLEDLADGLEACVDLLKSESPVYTQIVVASLPHYVNKIRELVSQIEKSNDSCTD